MATNNLVFSIIIPIIIFLSILWYFYSAGDRLRREEIKTLEGLSVIFMILIYFVLTLSPTVRETDNYNTKTLSEKEEYINKETKPEVYYPVVNMVEMYGKYTIIIDTGEELETIELDKNNLEYVADTDNMEFKMLGQDGGIVRDIGRE